AIHLMVGEVDTRENNPGERTRAIFQKMDANSDKLLTKEEFIKGCLSDEHLYRLLAQSDDKKST
ncbi:neuronal calcium sensor 2, partial [Clonorchis sinensis]